MQGTRAVGLCALRIKIIEQDHVEIGGRRHLARTKFAHAKNGATPAGHDPVFATEHALNMQEARAHHGACKRRIGRPGSDRVNGAGENAHADEEHLLLGDVAYVVQKRFRARRLLLHAGKARIVGSLVGLGAQQGWVNGGVQHMRTLRHDMGQTRRPAQNVAEQFAHAIIRFQDREQFNSRRHFRQRHVKSRQRSVRVAAAGE